MNPRIISAFCLLLIIGFAAVKGDEYNSSPESYSEDQYEESPDKLIPTSNDEKPKTIIEDMDTQTSALVQHDESDPDSIKNKGLCHHGIAVWYKPGFQIRCNCLQCTCKTGGKWDCNYHFAFCPYYYCGNVIYDPHKQVCCCGKVYTKKSDFHCCGYFYYSAHSAKCCNYYTVKPKASHCPRYKI